MRSLAVLLLLIVALAIWQPHLPLATADPVTSQVTLYAHTDPSAVSAEGRVLSLNANATSKNAAEVRDGLTFTLAPSLSAPLHVLGTIGVYVWLASQAPVRNGTVQVSISEVTANLSVIEIRSGSVNVDRLSSTPYLVIFGLGGANQTVGAGSAVSLSVQFSSEPESVGVSLLWDDPSTATRLVLPVEEPLTRILRITDVSGRNSTIFPENNTGMMRLIANATVVDPFGGLNVRTVSLSLTNSSGYSLIKDVPMNLTAGSEPPSRARYSLAIDAYSGRFTFALHVRDRAGRTLTTLRQVTIARFYAVSLALVDVQRKVLSGLNASFWAAGQLIGEVTTNSTGRAALQLPSSQAVGPLTLNVRKNGGVILSLEIDVESDSVLQIVLQLSDWNLHVRLQTLNLPVSNARVDLYFNGTFFASTMTNTNGVALFSAVPLGPYEVAVNSSLASRRFANVTDSLGQNETILELPIVEVIARALSGSRAFILVGVAIVAGFGTLMVARRRGRMRAFKHVADLLGGAIPGSAVMMIVGPSGSGRSLLLQNILADLLQNGRRCVYISNSELPSKIKDRLAKMKVEAQKHQREKTFRLVDAYSGGTGVASSEEHSVASPRDLTALGIQLTSCLEEVGGVGDVFFDSVGPIVSAGDSAQAFNFVEYYGARVAKSGGTFIYVAGATMENNLLSRFEEASDCVLQTERYAGPGKIRGRLLVKKARGLDHIRDWVGFKIASSGRMDFVSLPDQKR